MNSNLDRRHFLRAAGMALALPSLEAFSAPAAATVGPRNFVAVGTLGLASKRLLSQTDRYGL